MNVPNAEKCSNARNSSKRENRAEVSLDEIAFLGNVVAQFQAKTGKSVNYPCFLYNYFEAVPSEQWPCKEEIMETLAERLPKSFAARRRAKRSFKAWIKNQTPASVSN